MPDRHAKADSSFGRDQEPDFRAQGQAALLLVESVIHSLLDNGGLTKAQALEAIRTAEEVKHESLSDAKEPEATARKSLRLLGDMRRSIEAHSGPYDAAHDPRPRRD
jgi:hypothetical protein